MGLNGYGLEAKTIYLIKMLSLLAREIKFNKE